MSKKPPEPTTPPSEPEKKPEEQAPAAAPAETTQAAEAAQTATVSALLAQALDYSKELIEAAKAVQVAYEKATVAARCVENVSTLLLDQDAPLRLKSHFRKVTDADNHLVSSLAQLSELAESGKTTAKVLKGIQKAAEGIRYGAHRLYAQIQAHASAERAEEQRRRDEAAARQQDLFNKRTRRERD